MLAEQQEVDKCRRDLEELLPRARSLCFQYGRRDVFTGLRYVSLGRYAPQQRTDSAIGRAERSSIMDCLNKLAVACQEGNTRPAPIPDHPHAAKPPTSRFGFKLFCVLAVAVIGFVTLIAIARRIPTPPPNRSSNRSRPEPNGPQARIKARQRSADMSSSRQKAHSAPRRLAS